MNKLKQLQSQGYSDIAIAMMLGGPVGTPEYYNILKQLNHSFDSCCPRCGAYIFSGTGDCNCGED